MKRCAACGHENPEEAKFCQQCGAGIAVRCRGCGAELPPSARFCHACGAAVGDQSAVPARDRSPAVPARDRPAAPTRDRSSAPPDPRTYTPKHLADRILTSRAALEGERKQVTVLFADVKGSMELAEELDPEEWHAVLDRFFQILADGVHRYEGTINQYTGDGVMALFGAPLAHEDHAHRACYAALSLRDELRRYADELRLQQGLNFSVRMGINSGEVVVGKIGDDLRMDYTAQGHTVGLAARMEQLAAPDSAYVAEGTARLVDGFFALRDLGVSKLKGVREPTRVYVLEGIGRLRTRLDLSRARGLSRFVGRASEMQTLELALEQALAGNGQVVGAVGEPGVGKSRLCSEFVARCRARGIAVYQGHCVAHGRLLPMTPILEVLREIFGIRPEDDAREARRKIAGTLVLLSDEVREMLPLVFDMMGLADPEQPAPAMDPEVRQQRIYEFNKRMIRARSAREAALVFLDDLHWIDAASDAYLANWIEALRGTRTLMLVNFRPEYRAPWMATSYYQQLALQPLGAEAVRELLRHLLGADPSVQTLSARVEERAGGNPFFVEEIVQALVEARQLEGTRGAYHCVGPIDGMAIPRTVQAVLAARIDRLSERDKHVLQGASVIGRVAPEPLLKHVLGLPAAELAEALRALTAAEFLYEEALYPEAEYAFKHPLTREVAYGSQLTESRRRTHTAVARAIAEHATEDGRAALVAHHFENAGEAEEAADWHARAGDWVAARDSTAALGHWRRTWELARALPSSPRATARALSACSAMLWLGYRGGVPPAELAELFESGSALAREIGDQRTLAFLKLRYHFTNTWAGEASVAPALAAVAEAKRVAERLNDRDLMLAALVSESSIRYMEGRAREGLAAADAGLAFLGDDTSAVIGGLHPYPRLLLNKSAALANMGRRVEAERESDRLSVAVREIRARDPEAYAIAHTSWVMSSDLLGWAPAEALTHARQALETVEHQGSPIVRGFAYFGLGLARLLAGEPEEALAAAERSRVMINEAWTAARNRSLYLTLVARASLAVGDIERARAAADEAVATSVAHGTLLGEMGARVAQAKVLGRIGGSSALAEAKAALDRTLALVEETGCRAWEPRVREQLAEIARAEGDAVAAERELRAAHRLYTEMGITAHAERLGRDLTP